MMGSSDDFCNDVFQDTELEIVHFHYFLLGQLKLRRNALALNFGIH